MESFTWKKTINSSTHNKAACLRQPSVTFKSTSCISSIPFYLHGSQQQYDQFRQMSWLKKSNTNIITCLAYSWSMVTFPSFVVTLDKLYHHNQRSENSAFQSHLTVLVEKRLSYNEDLLCVSIQPLLLLHFLWYPWIPCSVGNLYDWNHETSCWTCNSRIST